MRGKSSPSANWRTLSLRVSSVCLSLRKIFTCECERERGKLAHTKGQVCLCFACVCMRVYCTVIHKCVHHVCSGNSISVVVEWTAVSTGCEMLKWAAWLYVRLSHILTHAAHYHSCAKGSGQGYRVSKNLWELNVFREMEGNWRFSKIKCLTGLFFSSSHTAATAHGYLSSLILSLSLQGKDLLTQKIPVWQQACSDPNKLPERAMLLAQQMGSAALGGTSPLHSSKSNLVISDPIPGAQPLPVPPELAVFMGSGLGHPGVSSGNDLYLLIGLFVFVLQINGVFVFCFVFFRVFLKSKWNGKMHF